MSRQYGDRMLSTMLKALAAALVAATILLFSSCSAAGLEGTLHVMSSSGEVGPDLAGRDVSGEITVVFVPAEGSVVGGIEFLLNGAVPEPAPWSDAPERTFAITLDSARLFDGEHVLAVRGVREDGGRVPGQVTARFMSANRGTEHELRMPRVDGPVLRGDPGFAPELLDRDMRVWYDRMWETIDLGVQDVAGSGDLREYGYPLQQYMAFLITGLRATGDLRFLDQVAQVAGTMADSLVTEWYDADDDRWYEPDDGTAGLRRFLLLHDEAGSDAGKDVQILSSILAHGTIAHFAYAFEANRGNTSPAGVDYGSLADFWTSYLVDDFEAIWRIRTEASWPAFPLWSHQVAHSWKSQMRWAFYMYKLTDRQPYLASANAYAQEVLRHTFVAESGDGRPVVWSHLLFEPQYGLQPVAYARYEYAIEADIALEGGLPGIDAAYLEMHARTLAEFVLDNGADDLAFDVGGMQSRVGESLLGSNRAALPSRDPWDDSGLAYRRESFDRFVQSYFTPLAYFGSTEHIVSVSERAFEAAGGPSNPIALGVPAGMLLVESRAD